MAIFPPNILNLDVQIQTVWVQLSGMSLPRKVVKNVSSGQVLGLRCGCTPGEAASPLLAGLLPNAKHVRVEGAACAGAARHSPRLPRCVLTPPEPPLFPGILWERTVQKRERFSARALWGNPLPTRGPSCCGLQLMGERDHYSEKKRIIPYHL